MTWTVGDGTYVLDERLRAGSSDEVRLGHVANDPSVRVLVTLTARHAAPELSRVSRDEPTLYVGATDPGVPYEDALVELLPPGVAASTRAPLPERAVVRIGAALADWVAAVHRRGACAGGLYPELVFVSEHDELAGVCPGGPEFIASAPQTTHGPRSYRVPYLPHEVLVLGKRLPASDVFTVCATLFFLGTGRHPFGDSRDLRQLIQRIAAGDAERWPGDGRLAAVLACGLAHDPQARPSADELNRLLTTA